MSSLVSVVVAIYNVDLYLEKCVKTIIDQSYKNLEILLVNDGSTDNSLDICKKFELIDSRIKVINKINGGLSDARNKGLELVSGEYVCFVDGDDYIDTKLVEKSIELAFKKKSDVVIFGFINEKHDLKGITTHSSEQRFDLEKPETMLSILGYAWNKLYKTSYLKLNSINFQKGLVLVEDICFNEKAFRKTNNIEFLNLPLYHYINRPTVTLIKKYHTNSFELHKIGFKARKEVMENFYKGHGELNNILAFSFFEGIKYCLTNMFYYKNSLSLIDKYKNVDLILKDDFTREYGNYLNSEKINDKILKYAAKYRLSIFLVILYEFRFRKVKGDSN